MARPVIEVSIGELSIIQEFTKNVIAQICSQKDTELNLIAIEELIKIYGAVGALKNPNRRRSLKNYEQESEGCTNNLSLTE